MKKSNIDILEVFKKFERIVIISLGVLLAIFISVSVLELAFLLFKEIFSINRVGVGYLLNLNEIKGVLGLVFNVLIAFELFETVRVYLKDNVFHAEYIILVALIALSRKVVLLDFGKTDAMIIIGLGVLITSLSVTYYLFKKAEK